MFDIGLRAHSFVYVILFYINDIMLISHSISVFLKLKTIFKDLSMVLGKCTSPLSFQSTA